MLSTLARTSGRLVARRSYSSATLDAHSQASSFLMTPFEKYTTLDKFCKSAPLNFFLKKIVFLIFLAKIKEFFQRKVFLKFFTFYVLPVIYL